MIIVDMINAFYILFEDVVNLLAAWVVVSGMLLSAVWMLSVPLIKRVR